MRSYMLILMLISVSAAQGGVYKWVDSDGVTHYGQVPPGNIDRKKFDVPSYNSSGGAVKKLPEKTYKKIEEAAKVISRGNKNASTLDCLEAVENGRYSVDSMLEVGRKNYKDGYIEKSEYNKMIPRLKDIKRSLSISECRTRSGKKKNFYLCLSNGANHIKACMDRFHSKR